MSDEGKFLIRFDNTHYDSRPSDEEVGKIRNRMQEKGVLQLTATEIAGKIAKGYSCSPGILVGGLKAENWTEQQVFMVDIDNKNYYEPLITIEEAIAICKKYGLCYSFIYRTFSHTKEKHRFRLVFICEKSITDPIERKIIIDTLISLFPQADKSCASAHSFFFGTDSFESVSTVYESARFSFEDILSLSVLLTEKSNEPKESSNFVDGDLDHLKREFDLLGYIKNKCGEIEHDGTNYVRFKDCCICGHHNDLVYYRDTNRFRCFGANGNVGGTIIDFIMHTENRGLKEAIHFFKHDVLGLDPSLYKPKVKIKFDSKDDDSSGEYQKLLGEFKPESRYQKSDKGNGELFADIFKDKVRYNVSSKEWVVYDGKRWLQDMGSMAVLRLAKKLADELMEYSKKIPADFIRVPFQEHYRKLGNLKARETMIKDARDKYSLKEEDFNRNTDLFNCQNGTIDLKSFEFNEHRSDDLLSKISNVYYNPEAKAPLFERFIDEIMEGDQSKIEYLQKVSGYAITADTKLETCFLLYGPSTRNGKSTYTETFMYMLGNTTGYALNMRPETLSQKHNYDSRQASGDIARLKDCRFLNVSEPPKRMIFDVALLKSFLGRDTITARHLHEREFEFIATFKLFINSNFLPQVPDDTLFSSGRITVIPFNKHFKPRQQDRTLKERLKKREEISGFFNWCLEGLRKFTTQGLDTPKSIREATNEYREQSDKVGNFIKECLVKTDKHSRAKEIYDCYSGWCLNNGFGRENKSNFFAELKAKGLFADKGTVNGKTERNIVMNHEIDE